MRGPRRAFAPPRSLVNVHDWDFGRYCDAHRNDFARLREQVAVLGFPRPGLVELLEEALIEGLHWLDSLDRADPFWSGTNHLPTVHKLVDRTRAVMTSDPLPRIAWYELATSVVDARKPVADHEIWTLLPPEIVRSEWLLEASWIELSGSGLFKAMATVADRVGCAAEFTEHLLRLSENGNDHVVSWARMELHAMSRSEPR
jgi:hypothetical protein